MNFEESNAQKRQTLIAKPLVHNDLWGKPRIKTCNCRSIIGMLICLKSISRLDISMAVHQCARYSREPMSSHEIAVIRIDRCLSDVAGRGLTWKVDKIKGLECYVDADFVGGW